MTHATISLGLMPNPPPLTLFVPPLRTNWDLLFQPLYDELLNPPSCVDHPTPKVIAPIVPVAPKPVASTEKDICSIVLSSDIVVPPSSNCLCEDLRSACDREHTKVLELEAEVLKQQMMVIESEKRNLIACFTYL
ncbi:hypothetical protein Tco_0106885 [Tanacetum coccineum]